MYAEGSERESNYHTTTWHFKFFHAVKAKLHKKKHMTEVGLVWNQSQEHSLNSENVYMTQLFLEPLWLRCSSDIVPRINNMSITVVMVRKYLK